MSAVAPTLRTLGIGPEYGDFLYATISGDANGTSVLSAMARMNLDPWQEAVTLAELPSKVAASRLAALIAAIPGMPPPDHPAVIAVRLLKLLPQPNRLGVSQQGRPRAPQRKYLRLLQDLLKVPGASNRLSPPKGAPRPRLAVHMVLLLIVLALAAQWYVANRSHTAAPSAAPATSTQPKSAR